ncbi:glycosyltransferase family 4 protein [Bifidobacterium choloepi]|uniref:Glycosyltransferase family 4 protein n=1 Tax=Bifidobacterium choloepi TaxID=2614131 RepID=A0A6I5N2G0_9BIFI|nr:glycosyltransferase family 4 protein [Bifidobacterium choloepi]NEG70365.1 glycosyltransferase family 4 protein [Bifidobacterium choloepi]
MKTRDHQMGTLPQVALITGGTLPVPNVQGGAIESLDMLLIEENEKQAVCHFTVFSVWNPAIEQFLRDRGPYRHTSFVFIKTPRLFHVGDHVMYRLAKAAHRANLMGYKYILQRLWFLRQVSLHLARANAEFHKVIIENSAASFRIFKRHGNGAQYLGNTYFHLHNEVFHAFGCLRELQEIRKVLGVSKYITDNFHNYLLSQGGRGLLEKQRGVCHNGIDTAGFGTAKAIREARNLRARHGIAEDELVFFFAGRLTEDKGAKELVEAFIEVARSVPEARLVVAGAFFFDTSMSSAYQEELRKLASNPQVRNRITFTGYIDHDDIPAAYAMADICVMPSTWQEPAGLTIIESLAAGKPLITTRSGGIPEYVDDSSAILIDCNDDLRSSLTDAMLRLATDPDFRTRLGRRGKTRASRYSAAAYYRRIIDSVLE